MVLPVKQTNRRERPHDSPSPQHTSLLFLPRKKQEVLFYKYCTFSNTCESASSVIQKMCKPALSVKQKMHKIALSIKQFLILVRCWLRRKTRFCRFCFFPPYYMGSTGVIPIFPLLIPNNARPYREIAVSLPPN